MIRGWEHDQTVYDRGRRHPQERVEAIILTKAEPKAGTPPTDGKRRDHLRVPKLWQETRRQTENVEIISGFRSYGRKRVKCLSASVQKLLPGNFQQAGRGQVRRAERAQLRGELEDARAQMLPEQRVVRVVLSRWLR